MPQKNSRCLGAFASSMIEKWYLDSGCSQHMIGNNSMLKNLQVFNQESEIFDDGARGRIIGTSSLIIPDLSRLKNVLLVEGLTVNLISVSQLFDENISQGISS